MKCFKCSTELSYAAGNIIGRSETCPKCKVHIRVCKNCKHYDIKGYNECRESQAERVVDKERSNFCDFFSPILAAGESPKTAAKDEAKAKLDALFKS